MVRSFWQCITFPPRIVDRNRVFFPDTSRSLRVPHRRAGTPPLATLLPGVSARDEGDAELERWLLHEWLCSRVKLHFDLGFLDLGFPTSYWFVIDFRHFFCIRTYRARLFSWNYRRPVIWRDSRGMQACLPRPQEDPHKCVAFEGTNTGCKFYLCPIENVS
jgi:hypothetical protein